MIIGTKPRALAREDSAALTRPVPVLVIDDDPEGAAATQRDLAAAGYPTAMAAGGDAVLRLVRAELMRLVISELYIACAEGPCVVAALKSERHRLPRLRVLTFSRHTAPVDDAWALAAGADSVLHKPASPRTLIGEVRRLDGVEVPGSARNADEEDTR